MAREMKNSGVKWIGDIPCDWGTLSPRYWISRRDAGNWGTDEKEDENDTVCIRIADFDYTKYCIKKGYEYTLRNYPKYIVKKLCLQKGDILIEKSGGGDKTPVGRTVMYDLDGPALFANFSERIRIDEPYCAKYALYAFVAHYGLGLSRLYFNQTTGLQNLIMSEFMSGVKLPLPSLDEQQAIAVFLDAKCAEIDGLLADLDAEVKILSEYKKSIIAETVTRGLNPNAPMKQSGIPWVGEIPNHWKVIANKYIMHKKKDIVPIYGGQDIISLSMNGVIVRDLDAGGKMPTTFNGYQHIYPGNLLMCLFDIDVTPRCIGLIKNDGLTSPAYSQFVMDGDAYAPYYYYFYLKMDNDKELVHLAKNMRHSLNEEQFGMIKTILPPREEQEKISAYLDEKCAAIDQSIADKTTQIETVKSYKASLIYEYVTGKKQVI